MSPAGLDTFNEMLSSGQNGLESFQHIEVPLSGGHKMMVRLTREENPEVAAKLPGPTWVVVCVEAKPKDAADGQPLLEDMIICGAFLSMDKANEAARQVLADITRGVEARKVEQIQKNGALACVAVSPIKTWMVEVKYESGIEYFSPPNDGVPSCSTCRRPQSALVNPLKNCARCKVTKYCSKECQKDGWKTHRHSCVPYSGAP
ncbi:hypothetical protein F5884DRAFT_760222 [Xylogone sp. PMI_703]|nr:hypothetical protein F5884DRAFT_760222 [Xylogone sp. PMI_703]